MAAWHFGTNTVLFASGTSTQRTLTQVVRDSDNLAGGYVEKASNLSQNDTCFVFSGQVVGNSVVFGAAQIDDNAFVLDSIVFDSQVFGNTTIISSYVSDSQVYDSAFITGSLVFQSSAYDNCNVDGSSLVDGAYVFGRAKVYNSSIRGGFVCGECTVSGSIVSGSGAFISGSSSNGSQYAVTFNSRGAPVLASPTVPNVINCTVTSSVTSGLHYNENI